MQLIYVKLQSASKREYFTPAWQQTSKDIQLLHCILVYWGCCRWVNCHPCLLCDGFLPVWSLNVSVKWLCLVLWRSRSLFDSEGPARIPDTHSLEVLRISFHHQTLHWKYLDVLSWWKFPTLPSTKYIRRCTTLQCFCDISNVKMIIQNPTPAFLPFKHTVHSFSFCRAVISSLLWAVCVFMLMDETGCALCKALLCS